MGREGDGGEGERWPYVSADDIPEQAEIHLLRQLRRRQRRSALLGSSWTLPAVALCSSVHRCYRRRVRDRGLSVGGRDFHGIPGEEPRSHRGALVTSSHTRAAAAGYISSGLAVAVAVAVGVMVTVMMQTSEPPCSGSACPGYSCSDNPCRRRSLMEAVCVPLCADGGGPRWSSGGGSVVR